MIQKVKKYKCEEPIKEIWKHLRYFSYIPSIEKYLKKLYPEVSERNLKKQSVQVSYCIRQAEEYFTAAKYVNLTTKPLLLYYGAVSLANALVLIRKDGSHSIDYLRKVKKHRHHGLEMVGNIEETKNKSELKDILNLVCCKYYSKIDNSTGTDQEIPWGQFPLFYDCITQTVFSYETRTANNKNSGVLVSNSIQNCVDKQELNTYSSTCFNVLELIKNLPDLYYTLHDFGISPNLAYGEIKHNVNRTLNQENVITSFKENFDFYLNGLSNENKDSIKQFYQEKIPNIVVGSEYDTNIHFKYSETYSETLQMSYFPDTVDDIRGDLFFIIKPEEYLLEPVSMYMILFNFGMLSRYYPDIWMKLIDSNKLFSEFILSVLNVINRKFPNLILDQLSNNKYHFYSA